MRITVYVPCRNGEQTLPAVLGAIGGQTRAADRLIFIDDHSSDHSAAIAREHGWEVHALSDKRGLAAGRNAALQLAEGGDGDLLVGFDADVAPEGDYLQKLQQTFEANPRAAAICGRLREKFTESAADLWRATHMPQDHGEKPILNPKLLFGATTAIRLGAARSVRGWAERYTTCYEDVDISNRLKSTGKTLLYAPQCVAWHHKRDTVDSVLRTHWNWHYVGFEHVVGDLSVWLRDRLQWIWNNYCQFRMLESRMPRLAYITLLMPWSLAMRDLAAIAAMEPAVGNVAELANVARDVLQRYGFDPKLVQRVHQWLVELAASVDGQSATRGPLHREAAAAMLNSALVCVPDATYARVCEEAGK